MGGDVIFSKYPCPKEEARQRTLELVTENSPGLGWVVDRSRNFCAYTYPCKKVWGKQYNSPVIYYGCARARAQQSLAAREAGGSNVHPAYLCAYSDRVAHTRLHHPAQITPYIHILTILSSSLNPCQDVRISIPKVIPNDVTYVFLHHTRRCMALFQ